MYGLITSAPFGWPQDGGRSVREHRLDLLATIASEATAYGRQLECEVGARAREGEERADVALNDSKRQRAELVVLAGNGVAVALQTRALPLESDSKLSALISCSCYAAGEELDRGDKQPCRCRGDGLLEVLGQAAVAAEPCKGPLDHPASGQDLEALGVV